MTKKKPPELAFQDHIAAFLVRVHGYAVLNQSEITDTGHGIAEDHLWSFLTDTQADTLKRLAEDYGSDVRGEVFRALHSELTHTPLWVLIRHGLPVRGLRLRLYYPKPRSSESDAMLNYPQNRIAFRPHYYFGDRSQEIDFVFFLNGLPIVDLEVKHEKNQNVHNAVAQFAARDHRLKIFRHPFLYLAADTSEVMAATDPRRAENFRWFNTGLTNQPQTPGEYPVEFLYREVLSREHLLEALSFFLVYAPAREAAADRPARPAFTLFPRYHQSRTVRRVADAVVERFIATGEIGGKFLIQHSAGSGKTLTICWLADRLHSLFRPGSNEKLVDLVFILTDRKTLDKNIKDELANFTHLTDLIGLARKAEDLPRFLAKRRPIVVTTQQKFAWILDRIRDDPALKSLRVAFLIDEAHRSQEGRMGVAIRIPFRNPDEPDLDDAADPAAAGDDAEAQIARIIREHDGNQLFVAFTATPAPATLTLFGAPFDTYTEAEAISEGYILDVATAILSYKTLYHLHCRYVPDPYQERLYPKGVVAKALKNVAFQDEGLIQYKAEVMLRIFDASIKPLIQGRANAMIVTSSRVAGLRYFEIIKEKLRERGADYQVLYAFSDFTHPQTNQAISEHAVNELKDGEQIEDRFEGDDYRLMVVANKFQTGFDQPLLAGMFLDKPVMDRNAVQTLSRLNRCHADKQTVVVVDFTNNAQAILNAFAKYRQGTPFQPDAPDEQACVRLHRQALAFGVFNQEDAGALVKLLATGSDAQIQFTVNGLRKRFQDRLAGADERKAFVYLLARLVRSYHFLTCFFTYPPELGAFVAFAELVGPQLIKDGPVSELMRQIRATEVVKAAVQYQGEVNRPGQIRLRPGQGTPGAGPTVPKVSVQDMIDAIRGQFAISDEEALCIKEVTQEKTGDAEIRETVLTHRQDLVYLEGSYQGQVNGRIQDAYALRGRYDELADRKYTDTGAIFDIMAVTVIRHHLALAA